MQLTSLTSVLPALTMLIGAASAVEIRFYYNTYGCSGNYNYWNNIPEKSCYKTPVDSHAVQFVGVPSGAKGQVYTDYPGGCSTWGGEGGSGTYCLNASFFYTANWFYPYKKLAMRDEAEEGPSSTGVQYTTPEGTVRRIACHEDEFDGVHKLIDAGDWDTLAGYPDDTIPAPSE